jgi:hypothetical protein
VYIHHIFFTHSSVDGRLGWYHVLPIVNSVAINMGLKVSLWYVDFMSFGLYPGVSTLLLRPSSRLNKINSN